MPRGDIDRMKLHSARLHARIHVFKDIQPKLGRYVLQSGDAEKPVEVTQ